MSDIWATIQPWTFCWEQPGRRCHIKITPSVSTPEVRERHHDDFLSIRTLWGQNKMVGYTLTFRGSPLIRTFGWSMAAAYGVVDSDDMILVVDGPHIRVVRAGTLTPTYHAVLRHK
jgi:hypothetical protein